MAVGWLNKVKEAQCADFSRMREHNLHVVQQALYGVKGHVGQEKLLVSGAATVIGPFLY